MKKLLIAAAVAAAGLTGTAYALPPSTTPQYVIYAGGGSAQPNAAYWAATQLLQNIDSYTDGASCAQSGTWRVLFGSAKAQIGSGANAIPAGAAVLFMYRFAGGTFTNGIGNVATATGLTYPTLAAVAGGSATGCGALPNPTYSIGTTPATESKVPDFGLSDEEVGLFNTKTNIPGTYTAVTGGQKFNPGTPLTSAQTGNLNSTGLYSNIMGIVVTNKVYAGTHPKTNFTKSEVAGILTGTIQNWNQLYADDGTVMASQPIVLLDRAPGSGTKAATNTYFLQNPGTNLEGGNLVAFNETTSSTGGGPTTLASSLGSGATCSAYTDINEKSSTTLYQDLQFLNTNNCLAVGILGLEFAPETTGGGYQFVKINGNDPFGRVTCNGTHTCATYANVINGNYDLFYTNGFNVRNKSVNGASFQGDGSAVQNFVTAMSTKLNDGAIPGGVSGQFPAGVTGILLDPLFPGPTTAPNSPCQTLGSRNGVSISPLAPALDASIIGGAIPACSDQLN
jgi:hypothetical protein